MSLHRLGFDPREQVLEHSADAAIILHPERGVVWASPAAENVIGLTPSELVGSLASDFVHPDHVTVAIHHRHIALRRGRSGPEEIQGRHGRRGYRWYSAEWWRVDVTGSGDDQRGDDTGDSADDGLVILHLRDAEEVRSVRAAILRSEARLLRLQRTSADITLIIDSSGTTTYLSPSVEHILGWEPKHVLSGDPFELLHPDDRQRIEEIKENMLHLDRTSYIGEVRVLHLDGRYRWMEINAVNLLTDPMVEGAVVHLHDVTDRRLAEEQLATATLHDPLTGLASFALMRDRVELALTRRDAAASSTVLVAVADLDSFASLNDALGHHDGDRLLVQAADRLRYLEEQGQTVARIAGDEFAICLEFGGDPHEALDRVEQIRSLLCAPYVIDGREHRLTCSAGLAVAGRGVTAEALIRDAGAAMHHAKGRGRNRTEIFDNAVRAAVVEELDLQADLDRALEHDELFLEFQPAFDTTTGRVSGVEALVRWRHPERGVLPPVAFIPAAERTHRIVHLGSWVARNAARTAADLQRSLHEDAPTVWINVAAAQLTVPGFAAELTAELTRLGVDPRRFGLEVTESTLIDSGGTAERELRELREAGCLLALDDFGTGYSSLTYLQRFEIDVIKIDRSFVDGLGRDRRSDSIVAAVTGMAGALSLRVVAEGVETDQQLRRLEELGCSDVSGFGLVRPVGREDLPGVVGRTLDDVRPGRDPLTTAAP